MSLIVNITARPRRHLFLSLTVALSLFTVSMTHAGEPAIEHARLALLLRQLDSLELQAEQAASLSPAPLQSRYHFDYQRLREDLQRVRGGVQDYLTPQRAQPRDPVDLHGDYRDEQAPSP